MMNRREFLKVGTVAAGAVALGTTLAAKEVGAATPEKVAGKQLYEIYALKYAGPFTSPLAFCYWKKGWDEPLERYYYIWVVKGKNETVIVDVGQGPTFSTKKKSPNYVNPLDVIDRLGISHKSVKKIVLTHIHQDHVGGMEDFPAAFPEATFYVQKQEYDFWLKSPVALNKKAFSASSDPLANKILLDMEGDERLRLVSGDQKIGPGLELLYTPGHTPHAQALAVETAKGTAVVCSDLAHIAQSFKEDWPSGLIADLPGWMVSFDKVKAKASSIDLLFPGHDKAMLLDYPKVAEDITRLV